MGKNDKLENDKQIYIKYVNFLRSYMEFYKESQKRPDKKFKEMMDESVELARTTEELNLTEAHDSADDAASSLDRMEEFSKRAVDYVGVFEEIQNLLKAKTAEEFNNKKNILHDHLDVPRTEEGIPDLDAFMKLYTKKTHFEPDLKNYEEKIKIVRDAVANAKTIKTKKEDNTDVKIQRDKITH